MHPSSPINERMAVNRKSLTIVEEYALLQRAKIAFSANPRTWAHRKHLDQFHNQFGALVSNILMKKIRSNFAFDDLISPGYIALYTALVKFDMSKGYRFSTYASYWIVHHVGREMDKTERAIAVPTGVTEELVKIKKAQARLRLVGEDPTHKNVAKMIGTTVSRVAEVLELTIQAQELDAPLIPGEKFTLADKTPAADAFAEVNSIIYIEQVLSLVNNPRDREILRLRLDGESMLGAARKVKMTGMGAKHSEKRAIRQIREFTGKVI